MSVVVLGMEMPDNCRKCRFMVNYWCYAKTENGQPGPICLYGRPDWCPLRPLPEKHGRLIDEGALRDTFGMGYSCEDCKQDVRDCSYDQVYTRMDFCGWLDNMETIVEAEGENDV